MDTKVSVEIDRPIEAVFEYVNDDTKLSEWIPMIVENEILTETPEGVGTTFRQVTEENGRRMVFQGTVTAHEENRRTAVHMVGSFFDLDVTYEFEDLGGRTRVTQQSKVEFKGLWKIIGFFMSLFMSKAGCKAQEDHFSNLKRILEGRGG